MTAKLEKAWVSETLWHKVVNRYNSFRDYLIGYDQGKRAYKRLKAHENDIQDSGVLCGDLLLHIFSFLSLDEKKRAARVCKHWYLLLNDNSLWSKGCLPGLTLPSVQIVHDVFAHIDAFYEEATKEFGVKDATVYGVKRFFHNSDEDIIKSLPIAFLKPFSDNDDTFQVALELFAEKCSALVRVDFSYCHDHKYDQSFRPKIIMLELTKMKLKGRQIQEINYESASINKWVIIASMKLFPKLVRLTLTDDWLLQDPDVTAVRKSSPALEVIVKKYVRPP